MAIISYFLYMVLSLKGIKTMDFALKKGFLLNFEP